MIKNILFLILMLAFNSAYATEGSGVGNGGISLVCRDSDQSITKVELLDIYEGKIRTGRIYDEGQVHPDIRIENVFKLLANHPDFSSKLHAELEKLKFITVYIPVGSLLESTADAFPVLRMKGCNFEQLANYTHDGQLLVSLELFSKLDSLNVGALWLHEAVYAVLRSRGEVDSQLTRKLIGYLLSQNVNQAEVIELLAFITEGIKDISVVVPEPKYPGSDLSLRIDDWASEIGICRLLGFEKVLAGSSKFDLSPKKSLVINGTGLIVKMKRNAPTVSEIVCINKVRVVPSPTLHLIVNPTHPTNGFNLRFNSWSKESGVCSLFGFTNSVTYSSLFSTDLKSSVEVDESGEIERVRKEVPYITEIYCIKS